MLTQDRLKELLHYCPETGAFTWLLNRGGKAKSGAVAGNLANHDYLTIGIAGKRYYAHRLAWLYIYGHFPPDGLDHINRSRSDNRICNLRLATQAENLQNISIPRHNTSGHIGVNWHQQAQKWRAHIVVNKKQRHLGLFSDISDAISARKSAEPKYHQFNQQVAA